MKPPEMIEREAWKNEAGAHVPEGKKRPAFHNTFRSSAAFKQVFLSLSTANMGMRSPDTIRIFKEMHTRERLAQSRKEQPGMIRATRERHPLFSFPFSERETRATARAPTLPWIHFRTERDLGSARGERPYRTSLDGYFPLTLEPIYVTRINGSPRVHERQGPERAVGKDAPTAVQDGNGAKNLEALVQKNLKNWQDRVFGPERIARQAYRIMTRKLVRERERLGR
jgi:hypothetical protein